VSPSLRALLITAFAEAPLQGNGAAVVQLEEPAAADWMQAVARVLRQSETAFLLPMHCLDPTGSAASAGDWALRWFTPRCEVPLCGHATLAATLALAHWGELAAGASLRFHSRSGPLSVRLDADLQGRADLVLPGGAMEPAPLPQDPQPLLGMVPQGSWRSALGYWVVLLPSEPSLAELDAIALVSRLEGELRRGLVLMQATPAGDAAPRLSAQSADYQLRFFAPELGIDEDPVTGSAHALVADWWCARLGRDRVVGWQSSPEGGGMVCERLSSGMIRLTGSGRVLWDGVLTACGDIAEAGEWLACLPTG
jgi:PhzF family phenazine biosynthesis protein